MTNESAAAAVYRVEKTNYVLGAATIALGLLTQSRAVALGLAIGVALTCLNFFVLRKLVFKWTREAAAGETGGASAMLALPKMLVMMLAVAGVILFLPIDPIAFTIGYSIFIVSILFDATYQALRTPDNGAGGNGTDDAHG